jgi:hypothetical protein
MKAGIIYFLQELLEKKIKDLGFNRRVAKKKAPIRDVNKKERVRWCKERTNWTVDEHWRKWIFSDESQIVIGQNNKIYVWRKGDERYNAQLVCPPCRRKRSIMIWDAFLMRGWGHLQVWKVL